MNDIVLKKIDESNFLEAFNLKLGQGQDEFVSNPVRSLAQAIINVRLSGFILKILWLAM